MVMARMHLLTVTKTAEHIVQQFLNESLCLCLENSCILALQDTFVLSYFISSAVTLAPTQKNNHYISVFSKEKKRMET